MPTAMPSHMDDVHDVISRQFLSKFTTTSSLQKLSHANVYSKAQRTTAVTRKPPNAALADLVSKMASEQHIKLWELAGENTQISISPFVWRVRLMLAYKGQSYESIPWRFMDKDAIKPFDKVPVMECNGKTMNESLDICKFLEKEFPEPSVFSTSCQSGAVGIDFIHGWANTTFLHTAFPVVLLDMLSHFTKSDQKYYRETREQMIGTTLEKFSEDQSAKLKAFRSALEPLRRTLKQFKFLGGNKISYADIAVAGNFMWARSVSKVALLDEDDPVYEWRERMFKQFECSISKAQTYPV